MGETVGNCGKLWEHVIRVRSVRKYDNGEKCEKM